MNEAMNEWKINECLISPWGQSWEGVFLKHLVKKCLLPIDAYVVNLIKKSVTRIVCTSNKVL